MKKLFVVFFITGFLVLNCASTGNVDNTEKNPNPEILGELYIEKNAGFSMYIPINWEIKDMSQKYLMVIGPTEDNFSPNINFVDEEYSGQIPEYIDAVIEFLSSFYADFSVIARDSFTTNKNYKGWFITFQGRINEIEARQKMFVVHNKLKTSVLVMTGTASAASGSKYDKLFDECMKTFNWIK